MTGKHAGLRTRYTARQRAELRGWVFRPLNPMPELVLRARAAHLRERIEATRERRAERRLLPGNYSGGKHPDAPLVDAERVYNYVRQIGVRRPLTPPQQRRRAHKAKCSRAELVR